MRMPLGLALNLQVQRLMSLTSPESWLTEHWANTWFYFPTPVTVCSLNFSRLKDKSPNDYAFCTKC